MRQEDGWATRAYATIKLILFEVAMFICILPQHLTIASDLPPRPAAHKKAGVSGAKVARTENVSRLFHGR